MMIPAPPGGQTGPRILKILPGWFQGALVAALLAATAAIVANASANPRDRFEEMSWLGGLLTGVAGVTISFKSYQLSRHSGVQSSATALSEEGQAGETHRHASPRPGGLGFDQINGKAIASIVLSVVGLLTASLGIPGLAGALFGHAALAELRKRGGSGANLARAGIGMGWFQVGIALSLGAVLITLWLNGVFAEA